MTNSPYIKRKFPKQTDILNFSRVSADNIAYLNSNDSNYSIVGIGLKYELVLYEQDNSPLKQLETFTQNSSYAYFGFLGYDFKNVLYPTLYSKNTDYDHLPIVHFFRADIYIEVFSKDIVYHYTEDISSSYIEQLHKNLNAKGYYSSFSTSNLSAYTMQTTIDKKTYTKQFKTIIEHIKRGDIYQMNYCYNFYAENVYRLNNAYEIYLELNKKSLSPFSCFYTTKNHTIFCASPENFFHKTQNTIYSSPIKGTKKAYPNNPDINAHIIEELLNSTKENSENVMITDVVRNDLASLSMNGSVNVDALFQVQSYPYVHQLVSHISAKIKTETTFSEIITHLFPMASMTGAPKLKAMEIIEKIETFKRSLYSGTIGYIKPHNVYNFNVVIRTLIHNKELGLLNAPFGGGITYLSNADDEYIETLTKAKPILDLFES